MSTSELETKIKKLRRRVKKLEAEQAALREKVDDRDIRIERLSTAMRQFASRLGRLESGNPLVEKS